MITNNIETSQPKERRLLHQFKLT